MAQPYTIQFRSMREYILHKATDAIWIVDRLFLRFKSTDGLVEWIRVKAVHHHVHNVRQLERKRAEEL